MRIVLLLGWLCVFSSGMADELPESNAFGRAIAVHKLKHIQADDAARQLENWLERRSGSGPQGPGQKTPGVEILPDPATNTLTVVSLRNVAPGITLKVHLLDMAELGRKFPRPPGAICCVYGSNALPQSIDLTASVDKWLSGPAAKELTLEEVRVLDALSGKANLCLRELPLKEAVKLIGNTADINIVFDNRALDELGISPEVARISSDATGVSFQLALEELLSPFGLGHVIRHEVVYVTSRTRLQDAIRTTAYPIADIAASVVDGKAVLDIEDVIARIRKTVRPGSWTADEVGASIRMIEERMWLVICQTEDGHEQIENLLAEIRTERLHRFGIPPQAP